MSHVNPLFEKMKPYLGKAKELAKELGEVKMAKRIGELEDGGAESLFNLINKSQYLPSGAPKHAETAENEA